MNNHRHLWLHGSTCFWLRPPHTHASDASHRHAGDYFLMHVHQEKKGRHNFTWVIRRRPPTPSLHASLNSSSTHLFLHSTAQSGALRPSGVRTRRPRASQPHALTLSSSRKWGTSLDFSLPPCFFHTKTKSEAVNPLCICPLYSCLMCESLCALLVTSPESWVPVMETAPNKSGSDSKAVKGRIKGGGGRSCFGGNRACELLNHHWKVIRKLAGPGGVGRTDCALPSTIPVMKWKRGGSVPGQISLHWFLLRP